MMLKGTEELKMVLDLAASNGRKEVENEMLESRNKQFRASALQDCSSRY